MDSQLCVGIFIGIIIVVVVLALMRGRSGSSGASSTPAPSEPASGKLKKGMSKTAEPTKIPSPAEKMGDKHEAKSKAVATEERKSKDAGLHKKRVEPMPQKTVGKKSADEPRKKGKLTKRNTEESGDGSHGVMK